MVSRRSATSPATMMASSLKVLSRRRSTTSLFSLKSVCRSEMAKTRIKKQTQTPKVVNSRKGCPLNEECGVPLPEAEVCDGGSESYRGGVSFADGQTLDDPHRCLGRDAFGLRQHA